MNNKRKEEQPRDRPFKWVEIGENKTGNSSSSLRNKYIYKRHSPVPKQLLAWMHVLLQQKNVFSVRRLRQKPINKHWKPRSVDQRLHIWVHFPISPLIAGANARYSSNCQVFPPSNWVLFSVVEVEVNKLSSLNGFGLNYSENFVLFIITLVNTLVVLSSCVSVFGALSSSHANNPALPNELVLLLLETWLRHQISVWGILPIRAPALTAFI